MEGSPDEADLPTPEKSSGHRKLVLGILLIVLVVAAAGFYLNDRAQRRKAAEFRGALVQFPSALAQVPLPSGKEPPVERFHAACQQLAGKMGVPAAEFEDGIVNAAKEIEFLSRKGESGASFDEENAADLVLIYIASDPENAETLDERIHVALKMAINHDADMHGTPPNANGETELRAIMAMERALHGEDHPDFIQVHYLVASSFSLQKHHKEAESETRAVLADSLRLNGPGNIWSRAAHDLLASVLRAQHDFAREEAALRDSLADDEKAPASAYRTEALNTNLVTCLLAQGKKEEASQLQARIKAMRSKPASE